MGFGRYGMALGGVTLLMAGLVPAVAQQAPGNGAPQNSQPVQPAGPVMPDAYRLNLLIRTAIVALNQANQTGNYTVLRDLGATPFRMSNDAARLAETFADLRKRKIDLSPVLFFMPKLVQQPQIDPRGLLRLTGYFTTAPEQVNFDIYYLLEGGQWRLFGIGVLMTPSSDATAALPSGGAEPKTAATAKPAAAAAKPEKRAASEPAAKPQPATPAKSTANAAPRLDLKPKGGAPTWATSAENAQTSGTLAGQ
jgi:hypothetical protein